MTYFSTQSRQLVSCLNSALFLSQTPWCKRAWTDHFKCKISVSETFVFEVLSKKWNKNVVRLQNRINICLLTKLLQLPTSNASPKHPGSPSKPPTHSLSRMRVPLPQVKVQGLHGVQSLKNAQGCNKKKKQVKSRDILIRCPTKLRTKLDQKQNLSKFD